VCRRAVLVMTRARANLCDKASQMPPPGLRPLIHKFATNIQMCKRVDVSIHTTQRCDAPSETDKVYAKRVRSCASVLSRPGCLLVCFDYEILRRSGIVWRALDVVASLANTKHTNKL
jgi:hypothetical protein